MSAERNHAASDKRRAGAGAEGHVARSDELTRVLVLASTALLIASTAGSAATHLLGYVRWSVGAAFTSPAPTAALERAIEMMARIAAPPIVASFAAAVIVGLVQVGPHFRPQLVAPDISRLRPARHRLRSVVGAGVDAFRLLSVGVLLLASAQHTVRTFALLPRETPHSAIATGFAEVLAGGGQVLALLVVFAICDFAWRRWLYGRDLRMTEDERRAETREAESSPEVRMRRRELWQQP